MVSDQQLRRIQPLHVNGERQLSDLEMGVLCDLYDSVEEKPFADAMSWMFGLAELLSENNAPEVRALKRMVESEAELNNIRMKVRLF
jgi:hypothetical protein